MYSSKSGVLIMLFKMLFVLLCIIMYIMLGFLEIYKVKKSFFLFEKFIIYIGATTERNIQGTSPSKYLLCSDWSNSQYTLVHLYIQ